LHGASETYHSAFTWVRQRLRDIIISTELPRNRGRIPKKWMSGIWDLDTGNRCNKIPN